MDDDNIDGRDRNGRWTKGHCPNRNGRPRKRPMVSQSDVTNFKDTLVEATIQGQPTKLTRHALLLHKMYEQSLKGSVLIQRKLFERFEQSDDTTSGSEFHLRHLGKKIIAHYDETGELDEKLYEEYCWLFLPLRRHEHYEAVNKAVQPARNRSKAMPVTPTWRVGPKPQAILDLEREWAEEEAAEKAARPRNARDPDRR